jgi:SAM-dependent methyltransferase
MKGAHIDTTTDSAWEEWGRRDPYFGVITDPKFRRSAIDDRAKQEFFESGRLHVHHVLTTIRHYINPQFAPQRVLDFGCGVGRLLVPFAAIAEEVIGLDVSPSMLDEARRNCGERQLPNVQLLPSDDALSSLSGTFDLIHSCIVFQHIPVERGRAILSTLLRHLSPGGVAAIHLTYSKSRFAATHGVAPPTPPISRIGVPTAQHGADPEIQMNPYNMTEIMFLMQSQGVQKVHLEFSDHGGELGVFLFFAVTGVELVATP